MHKVECVIPWLNDALVFFTVSLQLCQQLKDKVGHGGLWGRGVGLPLRHIGPARWQAAKPFHFGGILRALVIPPKHPQISIVPSTHTQQMGHNVAEQQYPLPNKLPLDDLEISPGSQGTAREAP